LRGGKSSHGCDPVGLNPIAAITDYVLIKKRKDFSKPVDPIRRFKKRNLFGEKGRGPKSKSSLVGRRASELKEVANLSRLVFLFGEYLFLCLLDACFFVRATEKFPA